MKQSQSRLIQGQVDSSRAMVELCGVKLSEVEPW